MSRAEVSGNVKVTDEAVIEGDSECKGNCVIYGKAWVYRSSYLNGNVKVYDEAQICNATLLDNVKAYGDAKIGGFNTLRGDTEAGFGYRSDKNIILDQYEKDMLEGKIGNSNKDVMITKEATVDATARENEEPRADFSKVKIFGNAGKAERD
jgi:NDP-sugar pyrophosphorylase family protein